MVERLEKQYGMAQNKGEFLMKRNLDLWVHSSEFVDNARPDHLTTPTSDHPLEYDRYYYQLGVAFELSSMALNTTGRDPVLELPRFLRHF
jgi:hypothetical protein